MKKLILLISLCLAFNSSVFSQAVAVSLSGYPIVTAGWIIGGDASAIDSTIRLTTNNTSRNGYVYYNTALNVTACGAFTVNFDYKVAYTGGCLGDGIAFYFINPMTSFSGGGGLGMPSPLTGFLLTMDTYDNDGDGQNPEYELMGFPAAGTYNEGTAARRLAPLLGRQTYMSDGAWHHVTITYNAGTIRVYLNGSLSPSMTGTFPISTPGYFGFSAGTGACISAHYVKSVFITSNTISPILGVTTVCQGSTTALSDSTSGGTWSSSTTSVATVGTSGIVTGVLTGTSVITYTYNSGACSATTTVNVVTPPTPITGPSSVCIGTTITLADATVGGTWTSSATGIATVGSSTGVVGGVSSGTAVITYSTGGTCYVTATVTAVSVPALIGGPLTVCTGATTTLTDAVGGGTWSSSATGIATIGSSSGVVGGITPGTTIVTYSLGATCTTTTTVTVNASPPAISGPSAVCTGSSITLSDAISGGTWTSTSTAIATVTPGPAGGGVVTGASPAGGTTIITYYAPGGCSTTKTITVNPLPGTITSVSAICVGEITTAFDAGGGTWLSSDASIGTVGLTTGLVGGVSGGSFTLTYTLPTGCFITGSMMVNPLPSGITGVRHMCVGASTTLFDATSGGTWASSNTSIASFDPFAGGTLYGVSAGTVTVTYTSPTTCYTTTTVTVDGAPPPITGVFSLCPGATTALSDASGGGTWTSSTPSVATIGSSSGIVYGIAPVSTIITYTALTGCTTNASIVVNTPPAAIGGTLRVCVGQTTVLTDPSGGGTWTSGDLSIATVTLGPIGGGIVTGVSSGTAVITYTQGTGCYATAVVTVNPGPGIIGGTPTVCVGSTTTLTDAGGGTWISSSSGIATAGLTTGVVGGVTPGTATITYSLGGSCVATRIVTVYALPPLCSVTGGGSYCAGGTGVHIGLGCSTALLSYQLFLAGSPVGLPITGTGAPIDFGLQTTAGVYTVVATNTVTGCSRNMTGSATVTVNPLPSAYTVSGGGTLCAGGAGVMITLLGSDIGVRYQLFNGAVAVGLPLTGTGSGLSFGPVTTAGTYTIVATNIATGCTSNMSGSATVTISPSPTACPVTGGGSYCAGGAGVAIGLGCSTAGVSYQLMMGLTPVGGPIAGTGSALSFGVFTTAGTYTVVATDATTGCSRNMTGSAIVTISPIPTITGGTAVCVSSSITLTASPSGGTWSSSNPANATVGSTSGTVTGLTTGTCTTITYTSIAGCTNTTTVCVSPSPSPISGAGSVCVGACTTESDVIPGGTWTSSNTSVATANLSSGSVCGVAPGVVTITYSLGSGCTVTRVMTVTPAPGTIGGPSVLCAGTTITLTDGTSGGTWMSTNIPVASVVSGTGVVTGVSAGTSTIIYTVGGCSASKVITVNSAPSAIGGPSSVCAGAAITLTNSISGGLWTTSNLSIASVDPADGTVTGGAVPVISVATITYSLGGACVATKVITVNPIAPIGGASGICVGATMTMTDAATGGTWISSSTATATIGLATGTLGGVAPGVTTITYTAPGGCTATKTVTVQPAPLPITGVMSVCAGGATTLLSDPIGGGTWASSNLTIASVDVSSGLVTGGTVSVPTTVTITYSLGSSCTKTAIVTVNPAPNITAATTRVCSGATITLSGSPAGGAWSSSSTATASVGAASGIVTGGIVTVPTTVTITYSALTGCGRNITITVNPIPQPISGSANICEGSTTTLSDATPGGTWSSGNLAIASVGALTGFVTGGTTPGTVTITYTAGGCSTTTLVTVIAPPPPIAGAPSVCAGQTTTFTDATPGGTWSSANTDIAIIGASTGVITGVSSGTVLIYYTVGSGCTVFRTIIVNPLSPVTGPSVVCKGQTIVLTDTTEGGAWSSSNTTVATTRGITSTTGLITGVDSGVVTISYILSTGCTATHIVTVNPGPPAITGIAKVCVGSVTALSDAAIGGGVWSSSDLSVATVTSTGVVSGVDAGLATITFTGRFTGCPATIVVTVNPLPDAIGGPSDVCVGQTIVLTDGGGGTWISSDPSLATVGFTSGIVGGIIPGIVTVTYTLPTGCTTAKIVNVAAPPAPITGVLQICLGSSTTLTDATPGGTWSSSAAGTATIDPAGNVTGMGLGTATISYTTAGSCAATAIVTVNPIPCGIGGTTVICQGQVTTLSDCMPGGSWSSSDASVATIGSLSGIVLGTGPGTALITYTIITTGCSISTIVFVSPAPDPIIGPDAICVNTTVTETDATPGGTWSSTRPTIASVDLVGNVYGATTGTAVISYTMPGSGCAATKNVTVNPQPGAIDGPTQVCVGATIGLSDAITGGTWTSSDIGIASVDLSTGTVYGVAPGTADITYSLGAGCTTFTTILVNPVPDAIGTPPMEVCVGQSKILTDATGGGTWSSGTLGIATADATTGDISGVSAGTTIISYILSGTGCFATAEFTVNPTPAAITGNPNICLGSTRTYISRTGGGTWSTSNGTIATIVDPTSGITLGVALGTATITYSLGHGCEVYQPVTVVPLPQVFNVMGGGSYCDGGAGVHIGLSGSATGVNYLLYHGSTATGTFAGTGGLLDFGLQTVAGSYTVIAISTATTCSNIMSGSALITIDPSVLPSVSINAVPGDTVCQGTSTTYTALPVNGGSAPVYSWDVNGTTVGIGNTYTFIPADGDVVTVTMTSNFPCASPAIVHHAKTITVTPFRQPSVALDIMPNDTVCQGTAVTVTAVPSFGGTTPAYTWLKNGFSAGATGTTYTFVPENGDSLRCIMISNYPCIAGSSTVSSPELVITVDTPLLPLVRINASPGTSIGKNQFDTLTASVTNGGEHPAYQWYLNGWPITGETNSIYVSNNYSLTRQDSVSCMVTSDAVCSMTTHQWVYINASDVSVKQVGAGSDIAVVPNPNKGTFIIRGTLAGTIDQEVSYELTDMLGQVVYRNKAMANNGKINEQVTLAHTIANGMYLLTLRTAEENKVFHIVIEQ